MSKSEALGILANLASHRLDNCDYDEDEIIEALEFILVYCGEKLDWKETK